MDTLHLIYIKEVPNPIDVYNDVKDGTKYKVKEVSRKIQFM